MTRYRLRWRKAAKKLLSTPLFSSLQTLYRGSGSILMYHRVTNSSHMVEAWDDPNAYEPHLGLSVSAEQFEFQMKYLRENTLPASLSDISELLDKPTTKKGFSIVTFDDGYRDNYELGLPLAEKYEIPIAIFVTSGFIQRTHFPWWIALERFIRGSMEISHHFLGEMPRATASFSEKRDVFFALDGFFRSLPVKRQEEEIESLVGSEFVRRFGEEFLSPDELARFAEHPLVTLCPHTVSHPLLANESEEDFMKEVLESKAFLEELTGEKPNCFAYPFGDKLACGEREARLMSSTGLDYAVTTRFGHVFPTHKETPFLLPRIAVDYFDDEVSFAHKLTGVQSFCDHPQNRILTL